MTMTSRAGRFGRRTVLGAAGLGALGSAVGCGSGDTDSKTGTCTDALVFPESTAAPQPDEVISQVPGTPRAWKKYPAPYQSIDKPPLSGGTVSSLHLMWGAPPPALDKNPWWQSLNERLGAKLTPTLVSYPDYSAKLLTLAASGQFPDITYINLPAAPAFERYVAEGAFHDVTDLLTGDNLNKFPNLARIPSLTWKGSSFQGRIYGVPYPVQPVNGIPPVYRKDWAAKLGVDDPKTPDDVITMLAAFHDGDPDGNGKKDTYAMTQNPFGWWKAMYKVVNNWRLNDDKTLTKDMETDEYRQALDYATKVWKSGAIHPDCLTLTATQGWDFLRAGKTAMHAGGGVSWYNNGPGSYLADLRKKTPDADLEPWSAMPGVDGQSPVWPIGSASYGFGAVPSSVSDDKVEALLHAMEIWAAPFGSEEFTFMYYGIENKTFKFVNGEPVGLDNENKNWASGTNYLCGQIEINYFFPGAPDRAIRMQKLQETLLSSSVADPTQGLYSPTLVKQAAVLAQVRSDVEAAVMVGRKPLSALDEAIADWKRQGGDKVRQELQDAMAKCA